MSDKDSKNKRTLDMYVRLCEGKIINKAEEAKRFGVDERSIQRDIDDIRAFIADLQVSNTSDNREIVYDRINKGFVLSGVESSMMSNAQILAVSKILLASRAFTKKEVASILDKMIAGCVPLKNMKLVSDLISNEKYHYVELQHKQSLDDTLWNLGEEVRSQNLIEITYLRQINAKDVVKRVVEPVAIIFSEFYFYLNAYIVEEDEKGLYQKKYSYPAIFRIDRIEKYREIGKKFKVEYRNRFEEGEFRKRVQFMFSGELTKLQIRYTGNSVNSILDRLPTAQIIANDDTGCVIEAEVYGKGVMMWLLSQGTMVEILKPESMRDEMKETLNKILAIYLT